VPTLVHVPQVSSTWWPTYRRCSIGRCIRASCRLQGGCRGVPNLGVGGSRGGRDGYRPPGPRAPRGHRRRCHRRQVCASVRGVDVVGRLLLGGRCGGRLAPLALLGLALRVGAGHVVGGAPRLLGALGRGAHPVGGRVPRPRRRRPLKQHQQTHFKR